MTGKRWFGPRTAGWGWCPVSWEGWTFTLMWVVVSVGGPPVLISIDRPHWIAPWVLLMVGFLAIVLVVKGYPVDEPGDGDDPRNDNL